MRASARCPAVFPHRHPSRGQRSGATPLLSWIVLSLLCVAGDAEGQLNATGAWTSPSDPLADWGFQQIHLALLRGGTVGDTTYHSYIFAMNETGGETASRDLYGWIPGDPGYTTYPGWNHLRSLGLANPPGGVNLFAAGHSTLADGRLLISGGHLGHDIGIVDARIFDPANRSWATPADTMHYPRWYSTNTTLPSGKVLTVAGSKWYKSLTFGGSSDLGSAGASINDLRPGRLRYPQAVWESPTAETPPANWPAAREGHVAAWLGRYRRMVVFGGRGTDGESRSDTRVLAYEQTGAESYTTTAELAPDGSRKRYRAVAVGDYDGNFMIVHGGKDLESNDVWGDVQRFASAGFGQPFTWSDLSQAGPSPGPRWGHAAAWEDQGKRVIVFGGRDGSDIANHNIYALTLSGSTATWQEIAPDSSLGGPPAGREGHSLVWAHGDEFTRGPGNKWSRMILFGGHDGSARMNDTWILWYRLNGAVWEWQWAPGPDGPPARTRHAALRDFSGQRTFLIGGDTGGPASAQDVWELKRSAPGDSTLVWAQAADQAPGLAGQTVVLGGVENANQPEMFDPQGAGSHSEVFDVFKQPYYPTMFVLPSGNVLHPATHTFTKILNTTDGHWTSIQIIAGGSGNQSFHGYGAAMYQPGKVVKAGKDNGLINQTARLEVDGLDRTTGWVTGQAMTGPERVHHNLVILPNGKVLVSGGNGVRQLEIWDPDAPPDGWWSGYGTLAENPAERGYLSAVLLLPDGRIATAGGQESSDATNVTIFTPPYLFNASGGLASRPDIQSAPANLTWGQTFTVCTSNPGAISKVALIRPGASTHAYDQNQRYVPLTHAVAPSGPPRLLVTAPASPDSAPPGDYLLFILGSSDGPDVPSIASWVRLQDIEGADPCDQTAVGVESGERLPGRFALYPSEPNPASSSALIRFDLPAESPVKLEVFDLLGRRVATLADRIFPAGRHEAAWNLRESGGATVRPGVYVYRLTAGEYRARGKMSVLPSGVLAR